MLPSFINNALSKNKVTAGIVSKLKKKRADKVFKRREKKVYFSGDQIIINQNTKLMELYIPAAIQHQKVFPKYQGCNKGKAVVVCATGPSFDKYVPIDGAIHIGVNSACLKEGIQWDYEFAYDFGGKDFYDKVIEHTSGIVFSGNNYKNPEHAIPRYYLDLPKVENIYADSYDYWLYGNDLEKWGLYVFNPDIDKTPIKSYGSSALVAFQFALWTHPDTIYLVGADCSAGGHSSVHKFGSTDYTFMIEPWRKMAEFAKHYYPDVKIISVNPVGLKGIFEDMYTTE